MELPLEVMVLIGVGLVLTSMLAAFGLLSPAALARGPRREVGLGPTDVAMGLGLMCIGLTVLAVTFHMSGLFPEAGQDPPPPLTPRQMIVAAFLNQAMVQLPVALLLIARAARARDGFRVLGLKPTRPGRDLGAGLAGLVIAMPLVLASSAVMVTVGQLLGHPEPKVGHEMLRAMVESESRWLLACMLLSAVVIAPLLEELMFRGLLQTSLLGVFGHEYRWSAVLVASFLFMLVHSGVPWQVLPGLFVLGVVMGWLYERTGSLWPSVLVHMGFNAVNSGVYLLQS